MSSGYYLLSDELLNCSPETKTKLMLTNLNLNKILERKKKEVNQFSLREITFLIT